MRRPCWLSHNVGALSRVSVAQDAASAVVGPLLGLLVLALSDGNVRVALWVAVVPAVVSALLVGLVHEGRPAPVPGVTDVSAQPAALLPTAIQPLPAPALRVIAV